ncbi:ROK family transcriptional regulator [Brachyspira pilosicoli]|uniref:ROK family protein n=1 Tax=Brachyspira pilosicoli TaxID=52584 RepID=UPI001C66BE3B|nr:ROK family transcriptional regulator [Brachyspira pilosicoli]
MLGKLKQSINYNDMQEMNRYLIIKLLMQLGICSRVELSKLSGLKQATITNIINDFIKIGLVSEIGPKNGIKGRRSIAISLNSDNYKFIGVRLTRRYITVGLFDIAGKSYLVREYKFNVNDGVNNTLKIIETSVHGILNEYSNDNIIAIGISLPGPFIRTTGIITVNEFPGWEQVLVEDYFNNIFHIPVFLEHDAKAGVMACWYMNKYNNVNKTLAYVIAGHGIGVGVIVDGKLLRGSTGTFGEIGHTSIDFNGPLCACGSRGCLENYCSTIALSRRIKNALELGAKSSLSIDFTFSDIVEAYKNKDDLTVKEVNKNIEYFSVGIVNLVNMVNPDVIIIGDEMVNFGDNFLNILKSNVSKRIIPDLYKKLDIRLGNFAEDEVLIGASIVAVESILKTGNLIKK